MLFRNHIRIVLPVRVNIAMKIDVFVEEEFSGAVVAAVGGAVESDLALIFRPPFPP